jgi:hypothetical protein
MKRALALLFASLLVACGGNVFVDDTGAAGGGATPSCLSVCAEVQAACPDKTDSCTSTCAAVDAITASGRCKSEVAAFLACLNDDPSATCHPDDDTCTAADHAYMDCTGLL